MYNSKPNKPFHPKLFLFLVFHQSNSDLKLSRTEISTGLLGIAATDLMIHCGKDLHSEGSVFWKNTEYSIGLETWPRKVAEF